MPDNVTVLADLDRPILIDGGLATQCEAMGCDIDHPLWSARLLLDAPQAIADAHRAYLDAGARIIATASYQASRAGFMDAGLSAEESDRLMLESVNIAIRTRNAYVDDNPGIDYMPRVAASIGPFGATLYDGSEYTGRYEVMRPELERFHGERLDLFDASDVDLIACETIPNVEEAHILSDLLRDVRRPAWVSFCCRNAKQISDGTRVAEVAGLFAGHPRVFAVGANCTAPQIILPLIRQLKQAAPDKDIVVYPNSGETYRVEDNSWAGDTARTGLGELVAEWVRSGATLVGGCCRVGPAEIRAIAETAAFAR